jgi:hypothetical protein
MANTLGVYVLQISTRDGKPAGGLGIVPPGGATGTARWAFAGVPNPFPVSRGPAQDAGSHLTWLLGPGGVVGTLFGFDLTGTPEGAEGTLGLSGGPSNQYVWEVVATPDSPSTAYRQSLLSESGLPPVAALV